MNKITIKNFVEEYNNRVDKLQETYLKENLEVISYLPFSYKNVLAEKLVNLTTFVYEDYLKENDSVGRRKTDKIKVDSVGQYLLFCRIVVENYTNLVVETNDFLEEYDLLKSSGLLDKLMVGTETVPPIIPASEISEMRSIISMKQSDVMTNHCEIHNYIDSLIERFGDVFSVVAKPIMEKAMDSIEIPEVENYLEV